MPASPLNPEEIASAARLKNLFVEWQRRKKDAGEAQSQEKVAELLGFNQSSLSQYLNGKIPLNIKAAVTFARNIGCKVEEFSPSIAAEITDAMAYARAPATSMPKNEETGDISSVVLLAVTYNNLSPEHKKRLLEYADDLRMQSANQADDAKKEIPSKKSLKVMDSNKRFSGV